MKSFGDEYDGLISPMFITSHTLPDLQDIPGLLLGNGCLEGEWSLPTLMSQPNVSDRDKREKPQRKWGQPSLRDKEDQTKSDAKRNSDSNSRFVYTDHNLVQWQENSSSTLVDENHVENSSYASDTNFSPLSNPEVLSSGCMLKEMSLQDFPFDFEESFQENSRKKM